MPEEPAPAQPRRVIGRVLSLGFPLPGVRVDNYSFLSAPAFFEYDALVVDPSALSRLIEGVIDGSTAAQTFAGAPVRNAPGQAGEARLGDVLLRRRDETRLLLGNGGTIVCFAHPAVTHTGIEGAGALDTYYWLDDPPTLVAGGGTQATIVDYQHPLAAFVLSQAANIAWRAYAAEPSRDAEAQGADRAQLTVFARSYGGAPLAFETARDGGRVAFVPALKAPPSGDGRYTLSETLQAGIRRMLGALAEGREPPWAASHALPGLDERTAALAEARTAAQDAQRELDAATAAHNELARYRRLLWQEGATGLEDVVLDALRRIGFDVYDRDRNDLQLRCGGTGVLLEIDASDREVGLAPHYRLRQRIEQALERRGEAPRGLLLINGHRLQPPAQRPPQASDALRTAADTMRYCVATTASLFDAVAAQLAGDEESVAAYRTGLMSSEGLLVDGD